ncbi:MAG: hypothetical protein IPG71_10540 [bacterium]|nr:hypothetical protein [bacterium]
MKLRIWLLTLLVALLSLAMTANAQIAAPANLTIVALPTDSVTLRWQAVPGASSYNIYKDTDSDIDQSFEYANTAATMYVDPQAAGSSYYYLVKAVIPVGCMTGTVLDTNGVALGGVLVAGTNQAFPEYTFQTYTLANGTYSVCDVPAGDYDVCIYKVRYPVQQHTATITDGGSATFDASFNAFSWTPVSGHLVSNTTWTNDNVYQLDGYVYIDSLVTLTIEEGTTIVGDYPDIALLVVSSGGDIQAVGSQYKPIVFTSNRPAGQRQPGDWGGIVINGRAHNNRGAIANGEGNSGSYGRADRLYDSESSGRLSYVRLEFSGFDFTPTNQLNGLCLQAVGSGTQIDHINVVDFKDDAIEFFGGSVSVSYLMLTDGEDDAFDWTEGWDGTAHHVVIRQTREFSDRALECDNQSTDGGGNHDAQPRSHPNLSNFTIIGKKGVTGTDGDNAITVRAGTEFAFRNFIVTRGRRDAFDLDDTATSLNGAASPGVANHDSVSMDYSMFWDNGNTASEAIDPSTGAGIGDGHFEVASSEYDSTNCQPSAAFPINTIHIAAPTGWTQNIARFNGCGYVGINATNRAANPSLLSVTAWPNAFDARPQAGSPALNPANAAPTLPAGLPVVPYVGAFSGPTDSWHIGWTTSATNN